MLVHQFPDRTITVNGEAYLYFGGTSYLGMATNPEFQEILAKNLTKWGSFYGSSRSSNVQLDIYEKFETYFADFVETEASLAVSSGTLAGKIVLEELAREQCDFFHYPKTHPAVLAANSQPLFIDGKLHPSIKNNQVKDIVITTDAILSGEVTPTNFDFLDAIPTNIKVTLVIDESHSLGIVSNNGKGIFSSVKYPNIHRKILVSSLGKALGLASGIIASDAEFIQNSKENATFTSSSGASPAYLSSFLEAQHIYKAQQVKLTKNLHFIAENLKQDSDYMFNKKYPVIYINNDGIFAELLAQKIVITSFKYPTYKKRMNRVVITSNHTQQDLTTLIKILNGNK